MPLPDSLTLEEFKARLDKELDVDDDLLSSFLEAAFEQASQAPPLGCGRTLVPEPALVEGADTAPPVQKVFRARGHRRYPRSVDVERTGLEAAPLSTSRYFSVPDCRLITQVVADDVVLGADEYFTLVRNDLIVRLELASPAQVVKVTGRWGYSELPEPLRDAIYTMASRAWYEREAQYADQVAVADGAPIQAYFRQLPPRAKLAFLSYTVPAGVAGLA